MGGRDVDVAVVGAGPAGSIAALVLARAGARVALVDKATFPRDKACGDLVGPRGLHLLSRLGLLGAEPAATGEPPGLAASSTGAPSPLSAGGGVAVGDMVVMGPAGRRALLPARAGSDDPVLGYPARGLVAPRRGFDDALRQAALAAGATAVHARVRALDTPGPLGARLHLSGGDQLSAGHVIGADGARGVTGRLAGLDRPEQVLWGFAVRGYLEVGPEVGPEAAQALPLLCLLPGPPGHRLPGYGWVFPGLAGELNVGVGVGLGRCAPAGAGGSGAGGSGATRAASLAGSLLAGELPRFLAWLERLELVPPGPRLRCVQGGWLRLGGRGAHPAGGPVLLTGDAAALVNPLQGEGIAPAMRSGELAAEAILAGPAQAARTYRDLLADSFGDCFAPGTEIHTALLAHPRAAARVADLLTAPGVRTAVAGAWALGWNDLVAGARPSSAALLARWAQTAGRVALHCGPPRRGGTRWPAARPP